MKTVELYADGACSGNPGVGGIGAVLEYRGMVKYISEAYPDTTNNRMELTAIIRGLESLKESCFVNIYSDSRYFCDAVNQNWIDAWEKKNWKKANGDPVMNVDLWKKYLDISGRHIINVEWVKGHDGHAQNELCDEMAVKAISEYKKTRIRR